MKFSYQVINFVQLQGEVTNYFYSVVINLGCSVEENNMVDCGYYLTTQQECEADGCCWRESDTPGLPWCFYKVSKYNYYGIDIAENVRVAHPAM